MRDYGRGLIFPENRFGLPFDDPAEREPWPYPEDEPPPSGRALSAARSSQVKVVDPTLPSRIEAHWRTHMDEAAEPRDKQKTGGDS